MAQIKGGGLAVLVAFVMTRYVFAAIIVVGLGLAVLYWQHASQQDELNTAEVPLEVEALPDEAQHDDEQASGSSPQVSADREIAASDDRPSSSEQPSEAERETATEAWLAAYACHDGCENELGGLAEEPSSLAEAQWLYRAGHPTAEERAYWTGSDAGLHDALQAAKRGNVRAMNTLASHYLKQGDPEAARTYGGYAAHHCSPLGARLEAQAHIEIGHVTSYSSALIAMREAYLLGDTTVIPVLYEAADAIGYEMWMLAGPDETALRAVTLAMQHHTHCRHPGFRPVDLG